MENFDKSIVNLVNSALMKASLHQGVTKEYLLSQKKIHLVSSRGEYLSMHDQSPLGDKAVRSVNVDSIIVDTDLVNTYLAAKATSNSSPSLHGFAIYSFVWGYLTKFIEMNKEVNECSISFHCAIDQNKHPNLPKEEYKQNKFQNIIFIIHTKQRFANFSLNDFSFVKEPRSQLPPEMKRVLDQNGLLFEIMNFNNNDNCYITRRNLIDYLIDYM